MRLRCREHHAAVSQTTLEKPGSIAATAIQSNSEYELRFIPSSQVYDGRYANLGWLQECPDPITKLVWDNAALINKTDADGLALTTGDVIEISLANHKLEIPVYVLWGQPKGVITLPLGYGRTDAGPIGGDVNHPSGPTDRMSPTEPVGFNTYKLRRNDQMYSAITSVTLNKLGRNHTLVSTQDFQQMDKPGTKGELERIGLKGNSGSVVRDATIEEYKAKPKFVDHVGHRFVVV